MDQSLNKFDWSSYWSIILYKLIRESVHQLITSKETIKFFKKHISEFSETFLQYHF